jgi:hypothetical protein
MVTVCPYNFFATKYTKMIIKGLRFFRDHARKKWAIGGSRDTQHLTAHATGFSTMSFA